VRFIIDTHCWLWWYSSPEKLGAEAYDLIADIGNEVTVSAASAWEIALKHSLGKLSLPEPPEVIVPRRLAEQAMFALPVALEHAVRVSTLPFHHSDPFDRLLIAQAQIEQVPLMTADEQLLPYDVELLWAGPTRPRRRRPPS
jgi:PIN domain nuclease of toxin-antitoxin system